MTELRKAAQDVIDCVDSPYIPDEIRMVDVNRIKALREALQAEPENPDGAVLMDAITAAFQRGFAEASSNCQGFLDSSPPSVDALIADAVAKEREACIADCKHWADQYPVDLWPENGESIDCKGAKMARLTANNIAETILTRSAK